MKDTYKEALYRLDLIIDEIEKIKRAIIAAQNGIPFTEAYNEEVYLEENQDQKKSYCTLMKVMKCLLETKYCTNEMSYDYYYEDAIKYMNKIVDYTLWGSHAEDLILIKYIGNELQDIYNWAVNRYEYDAQKYSDLKDGLKYMPDKCPWDLNQLMDDSIEDLLAKLPDME